MMYINCGCFSLQALGVAEFAVGPSGLAPFLQEVKGVVPVLCSNADFRAETNLDFTTVEKSIVLTKGGVRIGIVGAIRKDAALVSKTGKLDAPVA